jgi:predicted PurR-regulated permease PerM
MVHRKPGIGTQIHPNTIRQLFFLSVLIFLGGIIFKELYFMVSAFLGSVALYVILLYPMKYLMVVKRWWPSLAALFLMVVSLVIMVIPIAYMVGVAVEKLTPLLENPELLRHIIDEIHQYLLTNFGIDILNTENIEKINGQVLPMAQSTLGGTVSAIANIFFTYLILYFMLVQTRELQRWLRKNLPLKSGNVTTVIRDIRGLVYSNALGIPIVALIQGLAATLGYWIFGVDEYILMGVLTAISSVLPIIGTLAVYLPLAIYQFAVGESWEGIGVGLWGFIVIGAVDNIARFLVQKKLADVHPLITLFGVVIGINMFGFIGVIFGPLLLSVFLILTRIYADEFGKSNANHPEQLE